MIEAMHLMDGVPRETLEKFRTLETLVRRWNKSINLVGTGSLPEFWARHIDDSVFIAQSAPGSSPWLDIGSGGGFPGLVVAILYAGRRKVTLVESDTRKAAFLHTARRTLSIDVEILDRRIEEVNPLDVGVVSARALAPLPRLCELSYPLAGTDTILIFAKGRTWREEVVTANMGWDYDLKVIENPVSDSGVLLQITNLRRKTV